MKVLWVDTTSHLGGAQHSLFDFCTFLKNFGIEIIAAVPYGPLYDKLVKADLTVYPVSPKHAAERGWNFFKQKPNLLTQANTVPQIIRNVQPDIIHANNLAAFQTVQHASTKIPCIWHVRNLNFTGAIARQTSHKAAHMITLSELIDEYLVNTLSPSVLSRLRLMPDGINLKLYENMHKQTSRAQFNLPPTAPIVGMLAHLKPEKHHDVFIETAMLIHRSHPEVHFVMVGRDLLGKNPRASLSLAEMIQQAELTSCFHWLTTCDTAAAILPAFDIFIHPARHELDGRALCEAMAAGLPVIAVNSSTCDALIKHNATGILVSEGSAQQLAEQARELLNNPEHAKCLGAAGQEHIRKNLTLATTCAQLIKVYQTLLKARANPVEED